MILGIWGLTNSIVFLDKSCYDRILHVFCMNPKPTTAQGSAPAVAYVAGRK